MTKKGLADAIDWQEVAYLPLDEAMTLLGFAQTRQKDAPLYKDLSACVSFLQMSNRFLQMRMACRAETSDSYFATQPFNHFLSQVKQTHKETPDAHANSAQIHFHAMKKEMALNELANSILAKAFQKEMQGGHDIHHLERLSSGMDASAGFYKSQFYTIYNQFHETMMMANSIEMDSDDMKGLRRVDKEFGKARVVWNGYPVQYFLYPDTAMFIVWRLVNHHAKPAEKNAMSSVLPQLPPIAVGRGRAFDLADLDLNVLRIA